MDKPSRQLWTLSAQDVGQRLDVFVSRQLRIGRQQVKRLLDGGLVVRNGLRVGLKGKSHALQLGEVVEVRGGAVDEIIREPQLPLRILNQGAGWVAVDKPAGQAVHPLRPGEQGTVLNALAGRYEGLERIGEGGLRGGVVHRLDVETSGVLLVATAESAWPPLREAFKQHHAVKMYYALVEGRPPTSGRKEMTLYVARHRPAMVRVVDETCDPLPGGARRCDLQWRVLKQFERSALLEVQLGTGFLHQIRVMFAEMGFAVLGDRVYGRADPELPRQMLHAATVRVGSIEAHSPLPPDFVEALRGRGADAQWIVNLP